MSGAPRSPLEKELESIRSASRKLRNSTSDRKNEVLKRAASLLSEHQAEILKANQEDLAALDASSTAAFRDRLTLTPERLAQMAESLRQVAALPDPVGEVAERKELSNGLKLLRVRAPLGVILMIFESRPNVATEAFSIAFKAGNAIILRGGKESMRTTGVLYGLLQEALASQGLPRNCVWGITDPDRKVTQELLQQKRWIDVVVPRGGDRLIEYVTKNSQIPVIKNDRGMCHVYVDADADLDMAARIVANAKTDRPGVCNAMETLLVHERVAKQLLPKLHALLLPKKVEWLASQEALEILKGKDRVSLANDQSWDTEYLDLKLNCRIVPSLVEAIAHIEKHGSRHSEAIVTRNEKAARTFQAEVDAAVVYWNASTRFTDGFEFGLGGELGISTQKLHVRGPVGIRELTSYRWIGDGTGQIRGK